MLGALIGGLGSLLGGAASGYANYKATQATNETNKQIAKDATQANKEMAQAQMDFQENMSNSAYQRSMADMKKAGLNPMLAYSQGGASTPSGASGSAATGYAQAPQFDDIISPAISSALEVKRLKKDLSATESQIALNKTSEKTQEALTKLHENSAKVAEKNSQRLDAEMPAIKQRAKLDVARDTLSEKSATYDWATSRVDQGLGMVNSAKDIFTPKFAPRSKYLRKETVIDGRTGEILNETPYRP